MKILVLYQKHYGPGMTVLHGPYNDALKMQQMFNLSIKNGIFPKDTVVTVMGTKPINLNYDILFFSGHGMLYNGESYLVIPKTRKKPNTLSASDVISSKEIPNSTFLILDSCFSGRMKSFDPGLRMKTLDVTEFDDTNKIIEPVHSGLFSSGPNQPSYEVDINDMTYGAFVWALLNIVSLEIHTDRVNELNDITNKQLRRFSPQKCEFRGNGDTANKVIDAIQLYGNTW